MQTLKVSVKELETILANMPNSIGTFAFVEQLTAPRITKYFRGGAKVDSNLVPFEVTKKTKLKVLLNTDYEAGVVNQLERENKPKTDYKAGVNTMPLKFVGKNQFFGLFKGDGVLQYRPFDNSKPEIQYYKNGKAVLGLNPDSKELLAEFGDCLPTKSKAQNQGTTKEIFWRKLYVKHLLAITIHNTKYEVIK